MECHSALLGFRQTQPHKESQSGAQGAAVECRSTLLICQQTQPNKEKPELQDRIYGSDSHI